MEIFLGGGREKLDRLRQDVRAERAGVANEDFISQRAISRSQGMSGCLQDGRWTSHGDQRRGGAPWRFRNFGHADHGEHSDTFQFLAEALQRCRIHPSGGTGRQEAKNGRKLCGRRFQAAFQLGGLSMTLWYSSRKPDVFDVPAIAALKWSHSFICEPDFCCEFGAREAAQKLALEVALDGCHHVLPDQRSSSYPRTSTRPNLHVGFADVTHLRLSFEDDWKFHEFCLPSRYFSSGITPWSGCPKIAEMKQSRFQVCPWHDGGLARSGEPTYPIVASCSGRPPDESQFCPLSMDFTSIANVAVADPRVMPGVSSGDFSGRIASTEGQTTVLPNGALHCKITDNHFDNPARRLQPDPTEPDPDVIPDINEAPQFAQDLQNIADQNAAFTDPEGDGILRLRTWYLHHQHVLVNFHPRIVEVDEDWRRWADDIIGSWRTHMQAGASIYFHLALPDPYRGYLRRAVHCDIIITQGNDLPRRAGLLTVHYQGDQLEPHTYAVASSLEMFVSGRRLAEAADANQWCLNARHRCSISFGWQHIPFDFQQVHQVQNGHAFTITITSAPTSDDRAGQSHAPQQDCAVQEHDYEDLPHIDDAGHSPRSMQSASSQSSDPANEVGIHVYRLERPDGHCHVRWRDYRYILSDIVNFLRTTHNEVIGMHYLQALPVGLHQDHERAIILQMVSDIQAASSEQLILLDLEIHSHALPNGLLVPPTVSRKVMRIHPPVHRSQLLLLTGLHDYCELHGDKCIIFENNLIWPAHDRTVHNLRHGAYIRIQVPPPDDPFLDTETAIAISREFALQSDRGQQSTFCRANQPSSPRPRPDAGDGSTMLQLSIQRFVEVCSSWHEHWQPQQLKVSPEQVVHPSLRSERFGNPQGLPPPRPLSRFHGRDFDTLANYFASGSMIECEEEGPIAYVETWYIHHLQWPQCREPRAVKLFQDPATWLEDLLEPWRDLIDPSIDITIFLVRPSPPCPWTQCILAHLIIEQAPRPDQVVGLISVYDANFRGATIDHSAFSLPSLMSAQAVIRTADLQETCRSRSCAVRRGEIPFGLFDVDHVDPGMSLVVFVRDNGLFATSSAAANDDIVLMQRPLTPVPEGPQADAADDDQGPIFNFNPNAAPFCPGQAPLNVQPETIQELHEHWTRTAFSWEDESASTSVITWFVDQYHQPLRTCRQSRIVRLYADFDTWESTMRAAWPDLQLPGAPILFHLVLPVPPNTGPEVAAHVLLVQNPQDTFSSSVVTVFEVQDGSARFTHQLAITTHEHLLLEHPIFALGWEGRCLYPGAPSICEAWIGPTELRIGHPYPARDGMGIILQLRRRPNFQEQQMNRVDATNLLQIGTQLRQSRERRLTHGQVAHTHGPLSDSKHQPRRAIRLYKLGQELPQLPSFVDIEEPATANGVQQELKTFGISCEVLLLSSGHVALCLPTETHQNPNLRHFAYLPQCDPWTVHLHSMPVDSVSEIDHMRHLYKLGFEKAVLLHERHGDYDITEILFKESFGELPTSPGKQKTLPPWPQQQAVRKLDKMYHPSRAELSADCTLNCGITTDDLQAFFTSTKGSLCTSFENLDMPEICSQHFATLSHHSHFDRLVIYADGSSQARSRHIAPQLNEEVGIPDAWCFLVLGETYTSCNTSELSLIGWSSHQVRCDTDQDWYVGADRIGSAITEREALTWAMIWRIGQNSNIPTLFRSDSLLALQQAKGDIGSICCDMSFQTLRGCAQLLEAALAPGDFILDHVPGHAGDPFNEFCDWGAKYEGRQGFYLQRPKFCLTTWRPLIPYLWMLFDQKAGIPPFKGTGFAVDPPALPPEAPPAPKQQPSFKTSVIDFTISIATGNVLSLGQGPAGFKGKLDYLRSQFKDLHLNFLGVQETRAEAGSSLRNGILRLSSGADKGHGGVELWCNLAQPIALCNGKSICLARSHFTVVCHDSRRLLVRVLHEHFEAWFLVAMPPIAAIAVRRENNGGKPPKTWFWTLWMDKPHSLSALTPTRVLEMLMVLMFFCQDFALHLVRSFYVISLQIFGYVHQSPVQFMREPHVHRPPLLRKSSPLTMSSFLYTGQSIAPALASLKILILGTR